MTEVGENRRSNKEERREWRDLVSFPLFDSIKTSSEGWRSLIVWDIEVTPREVASYLFFHTLFFAQG